MKKISTAAAKQTRNFSEQKLTIGLDLGDRSSWYCVLDEVGEVVLERRVSTTPKAMREVFGGMPRSRIALETGMHSPWVSRLLSELGHEVIVAHARNVRLIGESRRKDDRFDARTLARLARIDPQLLSPVQHCSAQAQAHLMVIRARAGLVRTRTSLINTARGLTKSYGERLRGCSPRNLNAETARQLSPELQAALRTCRCPDPRCGWEPLWNREGNDCDYGTIFELAPGAKTRGPIWCYIVSRVSTGPSPR